MLLVEDEVAVVVSEEAEEGNKTEIEIGDEATLTWLL